MPFGRNHLGLAVSAALASAVFLSVVFTGRGRNNAPFAKRMNVCLGFGYGDGIDRFLRTCVLVPCFDVENGFSFQKRHFLLDFLGALPVGISFENDFRMIAKPYPRKTEGFRIGIDGKLNGFLLVVHNKIRTPADGFQFHFHFCGITATRRQRKKRRQQYYRQNNFADPIEKNPAHCFSPLLEKSL